MRLSDAKSEKLFGTPPGSVTLYTCSHCRDAGVPAAKTNLLALKRQERLARSSCPWASVRPYCMATEASNYAPGQRFETQFRLRVAADVIFKLLAS